MTTEDAFSRTVLARVKKTSDIEIHVSRLVAPNGKTFAEIREYVVSLDQYGRGLTFPATPDLVDGIGNGLADVETGE